MPTIKQLLTGALTEIRVARAGDAPSPDDLDLMLLLFNELLDEWNAKGQAAYTATVSDFVLTPGLNPHTIGPAASGPAGANPSFVVATARPVELIAAQLNLGGSPAAYLPIDLIDQARYRALSVPGLPQTLPTKLFYGPDWTDPTNLGTGYGTCYFWGVPQSALTVRLWYRLLLALVADTTLNVSYPMGYLSALRLTLAERAAPSFGQVIAKSTSDAARRARATIFGNNDDASYIATADAGLSSGGDRSAFNYANRSFR